MSRLKYLITDISAVYPGKSVAKRILGVLTNPSLHANILIRLALSSPRPFFWFFRLILTFKHSIDISPNIKIGRSLLLPHPVSIIIGDGTIIGDKVTIYQGVTIGQVSGKYPKIGDEVIIFPNSVIVGGIEVGKGSKIRALSFLDVNVGDGEIYEKR